MRMFSGAYLSWLLNKNLALLVPIEIKRCIPTHFNQTISQYFPKTTWHPLMLQTIYSEDMLIVWSTYQSFKV